MLVKWLAISGSWRYPVPEGDVEKCVTEALRTGKGIVTGGALGVDARAMRATLDHDPQRLRVILPTSLETFIDYHQARAASGMITQEQADVLCWMLEEAGNAGCVEEHPERARVGRESYFARNQDVVDAADEMTAFRVNFSSGTGDAIRRARAKGIPVTVHSYRTG